MITEMQSGEWFAAVDDLGAQLRAFGRSGESVLWSGDPAVWKDTSPLLFPIVGKLKGDRYTWRGQALHMAKHGFARDSRFQVAQSSPDQAVFTLSGDGSDPSYPFPFCISVSFHVRSGGLTITHTVVNTGADILPFSLGAHPGFACRAGDWLEFPDDAEADAYRLTEKMLLSDAPVETPVRDHRLLLTKSLFQKDALIFIGLRSREIRLHARSLGREIRIETGGAPCLGIWAKPGAPYVCVEPWYGCDDGERATGRFEDKPYLQTLRPREVFRFPVDIRVSFAKDAPGRDPLSRYSLTSTFR